MINFTNTGIVIFGLKIAYYALLMCLGAFLAAIIASNEANRRHCDTDVIWEILPWCLIAGLIGARLWHVLTPSASSLVDGKNPYFLEPLKIFNVRQGGLGISGAVIGGLVAAWIYTRIKKLKLATWLDICAPGVALAQAIGRWGNFFNQEIYGLPTSATKFPFAIYIDPAHRLSGHLLQAYYLPVFFYESIWNLVNLAILLWLPRKLGDRMKPGDNFLVYLLVYSTGRFFLEFIRLEYSPVAGININQTFMAVVGIVSLTALLLRHRKNKDKKLSAQPLS